MNTSALPKLALTRKLDEQILIQDKDGAECLITVARISGGQVRLIFSAEHDFQINRLEKHNQQA
jgi:sRNA-binding carbon storage regulator CsrA